MIYVLAAIVGFYFGNRVAGNAQGHCSCHTPIRSALFKYLGISLAMTLMVTMSGCATHSDCLHQVMGRLDTLESDVDELRRHGPAVGADFDGKIFWCRDADGRKWPSRGECD